MKTVISTREIDGELYNLVLREGDTSALLFESVEDYALTDDGEIAKSVAPDWLISDDCFYKKEIPVSMYNNDSLEEKMSKVGAVVEEYLNPTSIESYF